MARRRRAFSSCYCFSASFSSVVVCFQERTSCPCLNFAQSHRRRFTESCFGVSLRVSDAEPSRSRSPPPTVVRSSFEPSDLASNRESSELVAGVPRASQIWISDPISAILLPLIVRDPSMLNRRTVSSPSCFFDSDRSAPHHLPSPAASTDLLSARLSLHPPSAGLTLELEVLGQFWVLQIMGCVLVMDLMGLIDQTHVLISPQPNMLSFLRRCRSSNKPSPSAFISLVSHLHPLRVPSRVGDSTKREIVSPPRYQISSCRGHREIVSPPRYQISSCRGQRETVLFPILLLEGENLSTIFLAFMALVCCACVARSCLELEGGSSETLLSDLFKGSAKWCFVTPAKVAVFMIVISVLVAVPIANNRSLCVLFVSQGIVPLYSSKFVKVQRLPDDIYGLSVKIACIYPVIFHACVFRLPFEAAMIGLSPVVTIFSFFGVN